VITVAQVKQASHLYELWGLYTGLRKTVPLVPAKIVLGYLRHDEGLTLEQYVCAHTTGHTWSYSGTNYGGDDERYHGEGRCLCAQCGADGDA
jgi:hypothetical protein